MDGKKTYIIEINGIKESITEVERLIAKLDELSERINLLSNKTVNVATSADTSSIATPSPIELGAEGYDYATEAATIKEINKLKNESITLDAKIAATQDEVYQKVLQTKDLYKQSVKEQKEVAAQQRLTENAYENTMRGMKQQLADIKQVMQGVDLGDTEQMANLTKQADELNSKLLEIEKSYGQFGRQVGHYEIVAEGFKGLAIQVGDTTQQFDNAKQAMKELQKEMQTLSTKKDMGLISPEEEERLKNLIPVVAQLRSSIQDAGKPMDKIMDTMQSIVAITQAGKGIAAFFGFDSDEIERSIQKLVALQNAMQGLQTIQKQLQTQEGIGGWIAKANSAIDAFAAKVTGAKVAQDGLNASTTAGATASKTLTTAQNAQAVATTKATTATKELSTATKALSTALKALGIGLVVAAINAVISAEEKAKKANEDINKAYAEGSATITNYISILKNFNGSKDDEKKIVEELNTKLGESLGTYDSISKWYDVLTKKGALYVQLLQLQAKAQAAFNNLVEANEKEQKAKNATTDDYADWLSQLAGFVSPEWATKIRNRARVEAIQQATAYTQAAEEALEDANKELQQFMETNKIGSYAPQITKNSKNTKEAVKKNEEELGQLRLKLMKEGLNKTLKQLDIEKNALIEKIKQNGKNVADRIKEVNDIYAKLRTAEIKNYINKVEEELKEGAENIKKIKFEVNTKELSNQIDGITEKIQNLTLAAPKSNTLTTQVEYKTVTKGIDVNKLDAALMYDNLFEVSEVTQKADDFYKFLMAYLKNKNEEVRKKLLDVYNNVEGTEIEKLQKFYTAIQDEFEKEYSKELLVVRENQGALTKNLSESFAQRLKINEAYNESVIEQQINLYNKLKKAEDDRLNEEESFKLEEIKKEKDAVNTKLDIRRKELEDVIQNFKETSAATASFYEKGYAKYQEYEEKLKNLNDKYVNEKSVKEKQELIKKITNLEKERNAYLEKNPLIAEYKVYKDAAKKIEEIEKQMSDNSIAYSNQEGVLLDYYANKRKQIEIDTSLDIKRTKQKYYDNSLTDLREFLSSTNDALNDSMKYFEGWGILNIGATKSNLKEIGTAVETVLESIKEKKEQLDKDSKEGLIAPEARNATMSQFNDIEKSFKGFAKEVTEESKNVGVRLWESINQWVQQLGQTANSILSSLSEITSNQYEALIDEQEKYIDKLQEMYDKQKEITQKYADDVNSIEDELKTARGDRRQQLIDNLNAEMAAQRASLAQEKKIEKEKEKAEEKKKKLEHDQAVAKKKMDEYQAYVNMAMAISMAAVNKWPIPAIPMMALAAAATAAQIAAIKSQPIPSYGTGGMIEGKSHKEGGVKALVGNSPLELEGQEYVIRKKSTVSNVQVLDFINRSERKLNLDDFIDFYSSGKVKKHILSASPKARYADGGQVIPTLRTDIEINDRLVQSMEDYANRPYYVTVTEIEDAQANVRNVRVLSGLEE